MNDLPATERGLEAFASLLRAAIDPEWTDPTRDPRRGALQAFAERISDRLTGSQIGRYARGYIRPTQLETLEVLAAGMGITFDQARAVLDGKVAPGDLRLPADDVLRLNRMLDEVNVRLDEMTKLARRLTLLHTQSSRDVDPSRRRTKRGSVNRPRMNLVQDSVIMSA